MADDEVVEVRARDASTVTPRHLTAPFLLLGAALVVATIAAGASWWASGCHDAACPGARHRVTIEVTAVQPGDCWNNVGAAEVDGYRWYSDAHAPEAWGTGEVSGTLAVVRRPGQGYKAETAVFTADVGGQVSFYGGAKSSFSDLSCYIQG